MKNKKYLFILLLLIVTILPFSAKASSVFEKNGVVYVIGEEKISCQKENGKEVTITNPYYSPYSDKDKFVIEDEQTGEVYLYETESRVCRPASSEEKDIYNDKSRYEIEIYYEVVDNNKLYRVKSNLNTNKKDKEYVTNIDPSKFDLKKDGLPISFDDLVPTDFINYFKLGQKEYLIFYIYDEEQQESYNYLYTIDGTLVFPKSDEKAYHLSYTILDKKYLSYIVNKKDGTSYINFYDSNLNEIYKLKRTKIFTDANGNEYYDNDSVYFLATYENKIIMSLYYNKVDENNNTYYEVSLLTITDYQVLEGNNQVYNNSDLKFKFSGLLDMLDKVKVFDSNNKEILLKETDFEKTSGSVVIKLKNDFLKTLKQGTYTLKVEYKDGGYANATFKSNGNVPNTYDGIGNNIFMAIFSTLILSIGIIYI